MTTLAVALAADLWSLSVRDDVCGRQAELESRAGATIRAASDGTGGRVVLEVARAAGSLRGVLTIARVGETATQKTIDVASCDDAVEALALMASLAVSGAAAPPRDPPAQPAGTAPTAPSPLPASPERGLRWEAGVLVTFASTSAAIAAPSLEVAIRGPNENSPQLRLRASRAFVGTVRENNYRADVQVSEASVVACPLGWSTSVVTLAPCGIATLGWLEVASDAPVDPISSTRPWLTAGAVLRAEFPITSRFRLAAEGGGAVVFTRERYRIEPNVEIFRAPAVVGRGSLGVVVRFL